MKPLMIIRSDNDRSVPIPNAMLMVEALKKADAEFVFHHSKDLGHMGIISQVIEWSQEFIKQQSEKNKVTSALTKRQ